MFSAVQLGAVISALEIRLNSDCNVHAADLFRNITAWGCWPMLGPVYTNAVIWLTISLQLKLLRFLKRVAPKTGCNPNWSDMISLTLDVSGTLGAEYFSLGTLLHVVFISKLRDSTLMLSNPKLWKIYRKLCSEFNYNPVKYILLSSIFRRSMGPCEKVEDKDAG